MTSGDRVTLTIEKPAAGGRMIARHDGAVALVSAAIPGEVVEAVVEKVQRHTIWARTVTVLEASPDRLDPGNDWACGGNVLAHVRYERQLVLKSQIIADALSRIGRLQPPQELNVAASPTGGYRMRARLHASGGRLGFLREGTHQLCDPAASRQLLASTIDALRVLERAIGETAGVSEVELSENCPADQRAFHLVLHDGADPSRLAAALAEVTDVMGISCGQAGAGRALVVRGDPSVSDTFTVEGAHGTTDVTLKRQAHAFFQGNRYLLSSLLGAVCDSVPQGRVLDLYAGVGLFAVSLARRGDAQVVAIEGDRTSAADLKDNATVSGADIEARHQPVEVFLQSRHAKAFDTVIVDPPRTGMTKDALTLAIALRAERVVYVSCDVATFARDARLLVDGGYRMVAVRAFDLFPNTAHVETLAIFQRA
jgi:23S rRNA (uracil1939-C5)-methyltransferase